MAECKGLFVVVVWFVFKFFSESINEKIHVTISGDVENWDKIQYTFLTKTWKGKDGKHIFQQNRDYMTYSQHTLMEREHIMFWSTKTRHKQVSILFPVNTVWEVFAAAMRQGRKHHGQRCGNKQSMDP